MPPNAKPSQLSIIVDIIPIESVKDAETVINWIKTFIYNISCTSTLSKMSLLKTKFSG